MGGRHEKLQKSRGHKLLTVLKGWGQLFKCVPIVGPLTYGLYLFFRYGDGRKYIITIGYAKGFKFIKRVESNLSYLRGDYELAVQEVITHELKPGDTFYDVGAHLGFFSLVAFSQVRDSGYIIAIEPSPRSALLIRRLFSTNGISNYRVLKVAVSNERGYAQLATGKSPDMYQLKGLGEKQRPNRDNSPSMRVPTMTLDDIAGIYPPPRLIKIDIEGAEIIALMGADRILREFKPVLIIEVHGEDVGINSNKQAVGLYELLGRYNYRFFTLDGTPILEHVYHHYLVAR